MWSSTAGALAGVDLAIFFIVLLSGFIGVWRGLVKEVMSLASLVAAVIVVRLYTQILAAQFSAYIESDMIRAVLASSLLFISVMVLGSWLIRLCQKLLTFTGLRLLDRLAGGGFGILRGALIIMVLLYFAQPFLSGRPFWLESKGIQYAEDGLRRGMEYLIPIEPSLNNDDESSSQRVI